MSSSPVAYIAHPIGEMNGSAAITRQDNIAAAGDWIRFLAERTQWRLCCPWYALVVAFTDHRYDQRRLTDTLAVLERCDLLVLCGGFVSPHMRLYVQKARRIGQPIVDLTSLGILPPIDGEDALDEALRRTRDASTARLRRIWMPLMSPSDLRTLQSARHALYAHFPDGADDEVALLDRIIAALAATNP